MGFFRLPLMAALAGASVLGGGCMALAADTARYTRVNDRKACHFTQAKASNDGPESCEYVCAGPVPGVRTKLLSCYDYEHLKFEIDGKWFSTWAAMTAVGGMSGLGNKQGLVEWDFAPGAAGRAGLKGLIVRFSGIDGESRPKNALSVFSLKAGEICWKGNYPTNEAARAAIDGAACKGELTPEKP